MKIFIRKIKTLISIIYYHIISLSGSKKCEYYTMAETIDLAIKQKKSIIRLGDGEFNIINDRGVSYQSSDEQLKESILNIINKYLINDNCNYILCMPGEFLKPRGINLKYKHIISWAFSRYYFNKNYDVEITYGDAFIFAKGNDKVYSLLWQSNEIENIIFIHNNIKYANEFKKKYKKNITFIQVPVKDAYSSVNDIEKRIIKSVHDIKKTIILISAGPCAKVLVNRLSDNGYWAIDTGHCWDEPLHLRK